MPACGCARPRVAMNCFLETTDLAWREIGGQVIFLDIERDRYFRVPAQHNEDLTEQMAAGLKERWHLPRGFGLPGGWQDPAKGWKQCRSLSFSLPDLARSLWVQRRVEHRLSVQGFRTVLHATRTLLEQTSSRCAAEPDEAIGRFVQAFEQARLLRTAANRCLPRSIAMAIVLASQGVRCNVVIGVKRAPFAAHCWVQYGPAVLNDTLEEVQRYTPLLVL